MPLLPEGPFALAALALVVGGVGLVAFRRDVPKAYGLGALMFAVTLLDEVASLAGQPRTQGALGFQVDRFLAGEAWWSPLTSIFSHAPPLAGMAGRGGGFLAIHVIGNLLVLVTAGPALEERIGSRRFLVVFFAAGFGALAAHAAMAYGTDLVSPASIAIGASGAIFGVLTTFAVRYPRAPLPMLLLFFLVSLPAFVVLLLYLGFNLVYMIGDVVLPTGQTVAWWGHFAGFLVGLPFAYRLPADDPSGAPRGAKGLPDPDRLAPLATTPELRRLLDRARQFTPDARTQHDATFALAWIDRFLAEARCPSCGREMRRDGLTASCAGGETVVDLRRAY